MDTERWRQIDRLFAEALDLPKAEHPSFLDTACRGDERLRVDLERLLAAESRLGGFLEEPFGRVDAPPLASEVLGSRLGAYELLEILGHGGSCTVYLAGGRNDERFALKLCRHSLEAAELRRRFHCERAILAELDHPNVQRLFDAGSTADGRPYLVMELVEGTTIDRHCDDRRLSVEERLALFLQLGSAVAYSHGKRLVHRDLKPGNVLVTEEGRVKLLDFGIAKLLAPERFSVTTSSTQTGLRLMSASYASPEQMTGARITPASDVYSLGVLLFELLAGASPYRLEGPLPLAIEHAVCVAESEKMSDTVLDLLTRTASRWDDTDVAEASRRRGFGDPRALARRLRGDLDAIVARAIRKPPAQRYPSAAELSEDVRRHLEGRPVAARSGLAQALESCLRPWTALARQVSGQRGS